MKKKLSEKLESENKQYKNLRRKTRIKQKRKIER